MIKNKNIFKNLSLIELYVYQRFLILTSRGKLHNKEVRGSDFSVNSRVVKKLESERLIDFVTLSETCKYLYDTINLWGIVKNIYAAIALESMVTNELDIEESTIEEDSLKRLAAFITYSEEDFMSISKPILAAIYFSLNKFINEDKYIELCKLVMRRFISHYIGNLDIINNLK